MTTEYLYHRIDASHIRNLGEDSVSDKIQAILELAKNAYDADSFSCTVIFHGEKKGSGSKITSITIKDTGIGMTKADLENKFLNVGTSNKIQHTLSPKLKRRVSGEKGMGHYSIQRLGDKATITTTPEPYENREFDEIEDKHTFVLNLDWKEYKAGKQFNEVGNKLDIQNQSNTFGSIIHIESLNDDWTFKGKDNDLEILSKSLRSLVIPKELRDDKKDEFELTLCADGFPAENIAEIKSSLLQYAPYKMVSHLRGKQIHYQIFEPNEKHTKHIPIHDEVMPSTATCGDADFTVYWFPGILSEWATGVIGRGNLGNQLKERRGIKIFNDKIRIMPYGEKDDDWLELDFRKSGPAMGGKVRSLHLIGYVTLTRKKNPEIIETTTRQSLKKNTAFESLKDDFIIPLIIEMEYGKKISDEKKEKKIKTEHIIESEIKKIKRNLATIKIPKYEKVAFQKNLTTISKASKTQTKQSKKLEDRLTSNIEMYRNLSTVGIQTLAFNHEIINPIRLINGDLKNMIKKGKQFSNQDKLKKIELCLDRTKTALSWANHIKEFSALLAGADTTVKKRHIFNMKTSLEKILNEFEPIFKTVDIKPDPLVFYGKPPTLRMNKASFESIMINLISNSIRALKRVRRIRRIKIEVSKDETNIIIKFEDNGFGIKHENRKKIFRELFTTYKTPRDRGTGMGLTIIKEIIEEDYKGDIVLKKTIHEKEDAGNGMTMFEIKLPIEQVMRK